MKLRLLSLIVVLTISISAIAQWSELGGTNTSPFQNILLSLSSDAKGNIYASGNYYFYPSISQPMGSYVAKWNGNSWVELDSSTEYIINNYVQCTTVDIYGNLYVGGGLNDLNGNNYIGKWDGSHWSKLGNTTIPSKSIWNGITTIIADKIGNIYVGGSIDNSNGFKYVSKFNGKNWEELGGINTSKFDSIIKCLTIDQAGNIYAAGGFKNSNGFRYVAKWNGINWIELGGANDSTFNNTINTITTDSLGNVYAAGEFTNSNGNQYIAKWNGANWIELGGANTSLINSSIYSIKTDSSGNVYAVGYFRNPGSFGCSYVAKFDGIRWQELGGNSAFTSSTIINSITIDPTGYIYVGGNLENKKGNHIVAKYTVPLPPSPSLSIDLKDTSSCSFTVDVPVRGKGLNNISYLSGTIGWDTSFLNFGGIKFGGTGIVKDSADIDFSYITTGKLGINWSDTIGHSVADSTPVFTLTFYPKKNFSGGTGIWFDSTFYILEIDTAIGVAATKASFNDGWVLLSDTPTVVQVGAILQCFAGCSPIHYQWYNNGNPINGDTLNFITPDSSGSYTCTVTYINGSRVSSLPFHVVLPVTLVSYTVIASAVPVIASAAKQSVLNQWQTATEINTSHFNIQRSTNGIDFTTIGSVNAKGVGAYSYIDNNLPLAKGTLYYRLQIVDKDGALSYSDVRELSIINYQLSIAPNPAKNFVTITGSNIKEVCIVDLYGRTVVSKEVSNTNTIKLSVNNLSKGIYLVKAILIDGSIKTEKLVVE